jgi:hypothetical protein
MGPGRVCRASTGEGVRLCAKSHHLSAVRAEEHEAASHPEDPPRLLRVDPVRSPRRTIWLLGAAACIHTFASLIGETCNPDIVS